MKVFACIAGILIAFCTSNIFAEANKAKHAKVIGTRFPAIKTETLAGTPLSLPDDAGGSITLITIAFKHGTLPQLDSWLVTHMGAIALENAILLDNTQRSLQQLTALHTIDTTVAESLDLQLILKIILDQTITLLNLDAADILLYDTKFHKFKFAQGRGFENRFLVQMDMLFEDKTNTDILRARKIKRIDDIENSSLEQSLKTSLVDNGFHSSILVPLIAKNQIKGILEIFQKSKTVFDPDWEGFLETLAGQAAIAIDNATMFRELQISYRELKNAYETTLEGWSFALDLRDKETEGHTKRVTKLSISLAHELGLNDEELVHIRRGALLHDIGKMGIPDNILLKPGPHAFRL